MRGKLSEAIGQLLIRDEEMLQADGLDDGEIETLMEVRHQDLDEWIDRTIAYLVAELTGQTLVRRPRRLQ